MFTLLVGEIGYNRKEFLFELKFWEIRAIIKGFRKRARTIWESSRLNAYFIMSSMADLQKAGIHSDLDLVRFPWETDTPSGDQPTAEQIAELKAKMREFNVAFKPDFDVDE